MKRVFFSRLVSNSDTQSWNTGFNSRLGRNPFCPPLPVSVDSRQYMQNINGCLLLRLVLLTIHSHPNIHRYLTNAFEKH